MTRQIVPVWGREPGPLRRRLPAVVVLVLTLPLLVVGSILTPAGSGGDAAGTHVQMGLAACGLLENSGIPCATCGMTTAVTLAAHGRLVEAFLTQPAAAVLALVAAMGALLAAWSIVRGVDLAPLLLWLFRPAAVVVVIGLVVGAWLYKIAATVSVAG